MKLISRVCLLVCGERWRLFGRLNLGYLFPLCKLHFWKPHSFLTITLTFSCVHMHDFWYPEITELLHMRVKESFIVIITTKAKGDEEGSKKTFTYLHFVFIIRSWHSAVHHLFSPLHFSRRSYDCKFKLFPQLYDVTKKYNGYEKSWKWAFCFLKSWLYLSLTLKCMLLSFSREWVFGCNPFILLEF